jgi:hypothetical protein
MNVYPGDPFRNLNIRSLSVAWAACAVFVAVLTAACLIEADAQPAGQSTPGEDWVQLFSGKDLSGWTPVGAESWTVEEAGKGGLVSTYRWVGNEP